MPRLTAKRYLRTHDQLRKFWLRDHGLFSELSPTEQWELHDFFQLVKDWSDLQLLAHRDAITELHPSLPHRAGRALSKLHERSAVAAVRRIREAKVPATAGKRVAPGKRSFKIRAVAQPELDAQKLARAFINLAMDKAKKQNVELARRPDALDEDQDRARP